MGSYLLLNVNTQAVDVEATILREDGTGLVRTLQIPRARGWASGRPTRLDGQRFALFLRSFGSLKFWRASALPCLGPRRSLAAHGT